MPVPRLIVLRCFLLDGITDSLQGDTRPAVFTDRGRERRDFHRVERDAGIPAGYFSPLVPGPGFFARVDFDRLLAGFPQLGGGVDDDGEPQALGGLEGAIVFGTRFAPEALSSSWR